jgi:hypothetical protein
MAKAGYSLQTGAAVALTAATARTVLCVIAPASFGIDLKTIEIGFDGVTASAIPVLCEVMTSTLATNSTPGTNNTTGTVNQIYGRAITAGFTGFYASTAGNEPTVLTTIDAFTLTPNGGLVIRDWALGQTFDTAVSTGLVLRCTAPAAVNVRASFGFERC